MKYAHQIYAKALSEVVAGSLTEDKEKQVIKNFIALIKKNGDFHELKKIVAESEKLLRAKTGRRKITIETARAVKKLDGLVSAIAKKSDILEEKIDPDLIAGVKITVNDEEQFDGSLAKKLITLFK